MPFHDVEALQVEQVTSNNKTFSFSFIKANGTTRQAKGTSLSNAGYIPKGTSTKKFNPLVLPFFDVEANTVKSLRIDRLIPA